VHVAEAEKFIAEAAWRLALLRRMSPPSSANSDSPKAEAGARWRWPDALAVLQASPLTLLYMCKQARGEFSNFMENKSAHLQWYPCGHYGHIPHVSVCFGYECHA
jgi:hypothetical protein